MKSLTSNLRRLLTVCSLAIMSGAGFSQTIFTVTNNSPGAVVDDGYNGTLGSMGAAPVTVSGIPAGATITNIEVDVSASCTWVGDMVIKLQAPNGQILGLMSRPGLAETVDDGTNCCGSSNDWLGATVTFSDFGTTDAELMGQAGGAVCSTNGLCSYFPNPGSIATPPSSFANLFGGTMNGTWTLYIGDGGLGDPTTFSNWTLRITYFSGPPNDICPGAFPILCGNFITGSTVNATSDAALGICGAGVGGQPNNGIWYTMQGTGGTITLDMSNGTDYDSKLHVYTGTCGALTCIASDDDGGTGPSGLTSLVTFPSILGTTYYIVVNGFGSATGNFGLQVSSGPFAGPTITSSVAPVGPFCNQPQGGPGFPSNTACQTDICNADPFCCSTQWDNICASAAASTPSCTSCLTTNNNICNPQTVTLTSSSPTGNLWSNGATTQSITVSTSGAYTVTSSIGTCNSDPSAAWNITNPTPAIPTITSSVPVSPGPYCNEAQGGPGFPGNLACQTAICAADPFCCNNTWDGICASAAASNASCVSCRTNTINICTGQDVNLTSSAASGNIWSNGETTQTINVNSNGTFNVSATAQACTSNASTNINVVINPIPAAPTLTSNVAPAGPFCNQAQGGPGFAGNLACQADICAADPFCCNNSWDGICAGAAASTPSCIGCLSTSISVCEGTNVTLTSSVASGNTWSNGATTQTIAVTTSGSYSATTTANGCTSPASASQYVDIRPLPAAPTISASGPTTFCTGGSVTLTSSAATGNLWSNGATTQSITVSTAGSFTVTQTVNGCTSAPSAATTVTVNTIPSAPTISATGPTTFCDGGSVTLTSSAASGNTWSNGATTQAITIGSGGSFTVTQTVNGCTSPASAATLVTVNPLPAAPTITAGGATTFCDGGNVVLTSSVASGNTWSNGATTQSITVTTGGNYTVTQTASGCTSVASAPVAVTVNAIPATPVISASGPTTFCNGESVDLTSNATSGNEWNTGAITQTLTVSVPGTFNVTVTENGCESAVSNSITVTVNSIPATPTITASGSTSICDDGSVTLTSSAASGNEWSTGATTQSITVSDAGSYTVTVTENGCISNASNAVDVTILPDPSASFTVSGTSPTFSFTSTSQNATSVTWNFGDGSPTSNATNPSHTYTANGTFTVTLTVTNACGTSTATETVTVFGIGISESLEIGAFELFPNPTSEFINISFNSESEKAFYIKMYDLQGKELLNKNMGKIQGEFMTTLNVSDLAPGTYIISLNTQDGSKTTRRFVKM